MNATSAMPQSYWKSSTYKRASPSERQVGMRPHRGGGGRSGQLGIGPSHVDPVSSIDGSGQLYLRAEIRFAGQRWRHLHGRRGQAAFAAACADGGIIVANFDAPTLAGPCQVLDAAYLERSGAIAVDQSGNLVSVRDLSGARLWTRP